MLGQPGADRFFGRGGDDVIDARDGVRDFSIQCGRGTPPRKKPGGKGMTKPTGKAAGRALTDAFDPEPFNCAITKHGDPRPRPQRLTPAQSQAVAWSRLRGEN